MRRPIDIAVVGGGMTGLCMAALLGQSECADRMCVSLVDARPRMEFDAASGYALRVSAISQGSAAMLDALGAWVRVLDARCRAFDHMRVWDHSESIDGPSTLRFDADEFAVDHLGYIVENVLIQSALADLLATGAVNTHYESSIASVEFAKDRQTLTLSNGDSLDVDLIVAADGAQSMLRQAAGIDVHRTPYAQAAFVTHLEPERPHANTAWQRFLPEGPIGLLPLQDGRVSVVWSTVPARAEQALEASDDVLSDQLTSASDAVLGRLRAAGPRASFPLAAQHAQEYVRHGIALIGDAAHTIHPLAGQGANLGLADAEALAQTINTALEQGENPADRSVLRRYERSRKGTNAMMLHFMTGLNRLFASDSAILGELRRVGMGLFNKSGLVRERIVGVALGGR